MVGSEKHGARRLVALLLAATVLISGCSSAAPATQISQFAGKWAYAKKCDSGHFLGLDLQQNGDRVSGDWSEGTSAHGSGGKLEGRVREDKLYVRYCSDDGEVGYAACPEFSGNEDYFRIDKGTLVRYQKYGSSYRRDVALHPDGAGKDVPFDTKCMDKEDMP